MLNKLNKIMETLSTIEYGFKDPNGNNIISNQKKWDEDFDKFYYLLAPEELLKTKCGVCWDQVELERYLLDKEKINSSSYWICTYNNDNLPSHTFMVIEDNNAYYWFEHSWNKNKGIHKYKNLKLLLLDVKEKFAEDNKNIDTTNTFIYKYNKPAYHITCSEFYNYIETQKLIKLNEPLYFYHLVSKNADLRQGLLSLEYMYDNKLYDLFDKSAEKYINRITKDWDIPKYKNKEKITREEIIDGLNIFRGNNGASYIYFFKYPPYKELGPNMAEVLKYKDIYKININDEEVMKKIKDIFYGYNLSNSDNKQLDRNYYNNVSQEEYFTLYDDTNTMLFSTLNHIGISFVDNYCPKEFLEKEEI